MIISPASRSGRALRASGRRGALLPVSQLFRLEGGLPCAAAAGVASPFTAVDEVPDGAGVATESRPIIVSSVASAERSILERFLEELAIAPELAGELVALYVEQHPLLTLRFVTTALEADPQAAPRIRDAAALRAAAGLRGLALVMQAALALAAPLDDGLDTPTVIVDVGDLYFEVDPAG